MSVPAAILTVNVPVPPTICGATRAVPAAVRSLLSGLGPIAVSLNEFAATAGGMRSGIDIDEQSPVGRNSRQSDRHPLTRSVERCMAFCG
jgi:hypothetical protein